MLNDNFTPKHTEWSIINQDNYKWKQQLFKY